MANYNTPYPFQAKTYMLPHSTRELLVANPKPANFFKGGHDENHPLLEDIMRK